MTRTFSGVKTDDPGALEAALEGARSVRITVDGCLVYALDPDADVLDPATEKHVVVMRDEPLAHVTDPAQMAELQRLMRVGDFSDVICMCPGDLALGFLDAAGERPHRHPLRQARLARLAAMGRAGAGAGAGRRGVAAVAG